MKWRFDDILTFMSVIEAGSITSAAARLKISKSDDPDEATLANYLRSSLHGMSLALSGCKSRSRYIVSIPLCDAHTIIRSEQRARPFNGRFRMFIFGAPDEQHLAFMAVPAFKLHNARFQTTHVRRP
jgi:hypothetical protein